MELKSLEFNSNVFYYAGASPAPPSTKQRQLPTLTKFVKKNHRILNTHLPAAAGSVSLRRPQAENLHEYCDTYNSNLTLHSLALQRSEHEGKKKAWVLEEPRVKSNCSEYKRDDGLSEKDVDRYIGRSK